MASAILAVPSAAQAFTLLPSAGIEEVRWQEPVVRFVLDPRHSSFSPEQTLTIVTSALDLWNRVATSKLKAEIKDVARIEPSSLVRGQTNESAIVFDQNFDQTYPGVGPGVLAVGSAVRKDNAYIQGNIVVNAKHAHPSEERLKVVLAHEAGHVFGLGHSSEEAAMMYPTVRAVSKLGEDDVAGITYLYPRRELIDQAPFGCGTMTRIDKDLFSRSSMRGHLTLGWFLVFVAVWQTMRVRPYRLWFLRKSDLKDEQA